MNTMEFAKRHESARCLAKWRKEALWQENIDRTYASLDVVVCGSPSHPLDEQSFEVDDGVAAAALQLVAEKVAEDGCARLNPSSVTWKKEHDDVVGVRFELRGMFDLAYPDADKYALELLKGAD